jgi:hypothetical protein
MLCFLKLLSQKRCHVRERYKLDFDSYSRTVKSLREKSGVDPAKLSRKEAKLADSEALLEGFSEELFTAIRAMHENRPALVLPQLRQVRRPGACIGCFGLISAVCSSKRSSGTSSPRLHGK